jgi:hypothetical protein
VRNTRKLAAGDALTQIPARRPMAELSGALSQAAFKMRNRKNRRIFAAAWLAAVAVTAPGSFAADASSYVFPPVKATIATPDATAIPNPLFPSPYAFAHGSSRSYGFADMNADGRTDIIIAPTFYRNAPHLPIRILLQQPDGSFVDGTAQVIQGAIPSTGNVNEVLVGDFNEDGRPDILLVDQGLEDKAPVFEGAANKLLLSQPNGRYIDASANIVPNPKGFNHNGVIADFNRDGHLDVLITDLGTTDSRAGGLYVLLGDGKGNFVRSTDKLPAAARYSTFEQMNSVPQFQTTYGATLADLDGDGRLDLITATSNFLRAGETHNIRFYRQQSDRTFVEAGRWQVPPGLPFSNWGIWRPAVGDIDGDGRPDIAFFWETDGLTRAGILRNNGGFSFTDITVQALGSYDLSASSLGLSRLIKKVELLDINRDGLADLVLQTVEGLPDIASRSFVYLSNGNGTFSPWVPQSGGSSITAAQLNASLQCEWCGYVALLLPGRLRSLDLVLVDNQTNVSQAPLQTTALITYMFRDAFMTSAKSDCLFDWGEDNYASAISPPRQASQSASPYYFRFYPGTNSYLGTSSADQHLYYYLPASGQMTDLGLAATWAGLAGCQ